MDNGLFRRFLRGAVHLLGGLGAGLAIMMIFSAWKLSSGPISLAFLTPYIESTLATFHKSLRIRLDDTILTWAGWERTLDIRVLGVRVLGQDDVLIASVPELSLSLSARALIKGMIAPKSIEMFRPTLKLVRLADGTLEIGLNSESSTSRQFTKQLFAVLQAKPDPSHPMSFLSKINIFDADLQVVDHKLGTSWSAPKAKVQLWRTDKGINGEVTMDVLAGGSKTNVSVMGSYLASQNRFDVGVDFNSFTPAAFASLSPQLARLSNLQLPFEGTLTLSMLSDGSLESLGFDVSAAKGTISMSEQRARQLGLPWLAQPLNVEGLQFDGRYEGGTGRIEISNLDVDFGEGGNIYLPAPVDQMVPIKTLSAQGRYLGNAKRLELDRFDVDLDGPKATVSLSLNEQDDGISFDVSGTFDNGGKSAGDAKAGVSVMGTYLASQQRLDLGVDFSSFTPAAFAGFLPQLSPLKSLQLPLQGTLTLSMASDGSLESLGFDVSAAEGALSIPVKTAQQLGVLSLAQRVEVASLRVDGRYDGATEKIEINKLDVDFGAGGKIYLPAPIEHEMPIKSLSAQGRYLSKASRLELDQLDLDLNGPRATLTLNMIVQNGTSTIDASGVLRDMEANRLSRYWPNSLATSTRNWIVDNITDGTVPEARATAQIRLTKDQGFELLSLSGDLSIADVTVDYFAPMAKAVNTNASAHFTKQKLDIFITHAKAEGLSTNKSIISFSGMDQDDQRADIDLFLDSSLENALKFIGSEPLELSSAIGIKPELAQGRAEAHVKISFPMVSNLTTEQVDISLVAQMHDVLIDNIFLGQGIKDGQLDMKVNRFGLDMSGDVKISDIPASFEWRRNFGTEVSFRQKYKISSRIDNIHNLRNLGIDLSPLHGEFIKGGVDANIQLITQDDGKGKAQVRLDLNQASLSVPALGWTKPVGTDGIALVDFSLDGTDLTDITYFSVAAGDLRINGSAHYDERGTGLGKININQFTLNRTDLAGIIVPGSDGGWTVSFHGPSFDLEPMFDELFKGSADEEEKIGLNISLSAKVDKVWIGPKKHLKQITGTFARANERWRSINVDGSLGSGNRFKVILRPTGTDKRGIVITADNAGEMLRTLDIYNTMIGGKLKVEAAFDDTDPGHPLKGLVMITDYRVVEAPTLARLAGILSQTGISEALQGDGLSFDEFKAPFVMKEGVIDITDVKATGLSLGYTAKGRIYNNAEVIDIEGTVVPAYAINSALGNIPIIGVLLTGLEEGGGIFAATYKMTGPIENPVVKVNPLAALAPGIFRNLFGILTNDRKEDTNSAGAGESQRKKYFGKSEGL